MIVTLLIFNIWLKEIKSVHGFAQSVTVEYIQAPITKKTTSSVN